MDLADKLKEIIDLSGRASPGPWEHTGRPGGWDGIDAKIGDSTTHIASLEFNNPYNATFMAASRALVPKLARALTVAVKELSDVVSKGYYDDVQAKETSSQILEEIRNILNGD